MTTTIMCPCGMTHIIDPPENDAETTAKEAEETTEETELTNAGDITTHTQHPNWTNTTLGFTTPALDYKHQED